MNVIVDSKLLRCPHCKNPFLANWISSNLDYIDRETALMFAEKKKYTDLYCYSPKGKEIYIYTPSLRYKWHKDYFPSDNLVTWGCKCGFTSHDYRVFL